MTFRKRMKDQSTLMLAGMACLLAGFATHQLMHPVTVGWRDASDAAFGYFVGLAIGLNLMSAWRASRRRRGERSQSCESR